MAEQIKHFMILCISLMVAHFICILYTSFVVYIAWPGSSKYMYVETIIKHEQRLTILNMPTIAFRHLRGTMIDTYKYATHKYKCQLLNFNTRSNGYKLVKNRCNTVKYQNFYTNSTVNAWNSLPAEVVSADTANPSLQS